MAVLGLFLGVLGPTTSAAAFSLTLPKISSFSPASGAASTPVTIIGSGFTGATAVRFNGAASVFTVNSSSKITAEVPAMPSAVGPVTVTTLAGTAKSPSRFTVTPAVLLSGATGPPGSAVTVSGTGFGSLEGADIFLDTTDLALAGTSPVGSFGPITVNVPAAAAPGTHWISAAGRRSGLFAQAAFTVNTDWAGFRYSRKHRGFNPFENVLSTGNVGLIDENGFFTSGGAIDSSPAVVGGVLYFGSADHNVYALNVATGAQPWTFTTHGSVESSPAVVGGVVYVGSADDHVYALNAATGALLWNFTAGGFVDSSPAVAHGVVYVGSADGNVWAINAATGIKLWSFATGGGIFSSPAVVSGVVYIGSGDGNVYALNAATGAELWHFTTGGNVGSSPALANGVVYIGSDDGNVYALNAATGAELWHFSTGSPVESSPAVAYGAVYVGSENLNVYALNAATGTPLWHFATGSLVLSSPAVADGVVYVGSFDGNLYALSAATGDRLWTFTTGGLVFSSPAVVNGAIYAGSEDGNLYLFDLAGGPATPARPSRISLHPDFSLREQR
jgi:outer membrane protein assembly factor BamB